ncbi:uncharacterized protein N7477_001229 [Penicillium maclennaniae]|uniref:uncharacterized protein n=1 Tax=Penicillium maclennaniae TaxID=1343394 RepID=UPI002541375A|nr:uncharacterized protein N7477_001229 [Penicillium maclennaniae]KAJ5684884.1 hypothetical protein N7477_001229 [Penicillium maclennaniae]
MAGSRSSSERTGSMHSQESPKILRTKADPNLALHEAQPSMNPVADRNVFSLRSIQHKDRSGQIISDPDLSNPTRARLERPLDTIRSFQAAIDAERKQNRM